MNLSLPDVRFWLKDKKKMENILIGSHDAETISFIFHTQDEWQCVKDIIDYSDNKSESLYLPEKREVLFSSEDAIPLMNVGYFDKTCTKMVYEGDVVKIDDGLPFVVKYEYECFNLDNSKFATHLDSGMEYITNLEVLGNLYEDPELESEIFSI
jgi:hypothetical protein